MRLLRSIILLACLLAPSWVQAQSFPTDWYWVVGDTNPSTQVWQGKGGAFVNDTVSDYLTWLTNMSTSPAFLNPGLVFPVASTTNNGSGAIRLTLTIPAGGNLNWATNRIVTVTGVSGSTNANGTFAITPIDATHVDLQSSTFDSPGTGGVAGSGSSIGFAADLYSYINQYNSSLTTLGSSSTNISTSVDFHLTNPLQRQLIVNYGQPGHNLFMPQMNLFGSLAMGLPVTVTNIGVNSVTLKGFSSTPIATVLPGQVWLVTLLYNGNQEGTYSASVMTRTQPACGDLANSALSCSVDTTNAGNISSGTLPAARLPNPSASTLGGVESYAAVLHQWINQVSTSGVHSSSQPACADLSDNASVCAGGQYRASITGVDFSSANTDHAIPIVLPAGFTRILFAAIEVSHANANLTSATGGFFTATGGGGLTISANTAMTISSTAENTVNNSQIFSQPGGTQSFQPSSFGTPGTIYFRVGTSTTGTADVTITYRVVP